jgi:hypothetical protein
MTGTLAADTLEFTLPWTAADPRRFYRAVAVP